MALNVNVGLIVFCLLCLLSITVFGVEVELKQGSYDVEAARRMMIGSRPPRCLERCLNCKPCMPTLVIALRKKRLEIHRDRNNEDGRDNYYLLVWKCKCGNKLFQP